MRARGWEPPRRREAGPPPVNPPSPPYPVKLAPALRADVGAVERAIADRTAVLLDSRATSFFQGSAKSPQALRPGRLPGSVQLDHVAAFDPTAMALRPKA